MKFIFCALMAISFSVSSLTACTENPLNQTADKSSDEAIIQQAEILINDLKYTEALLNLDLVSTKGKLKREYRILYSSALAGQCGLNFITYFSRLAEAQNVTGIFSFTMAGFSSVVVDAESCKQAMEIMRDLAGSDMIGDNSDEQLYMAVLGLATMGAILAEKADTDGTGGAGNGTVDSGFNICASTGTSAVTDDSVKHLLTAFSAVLLNIGGLADADSVSTAITDMAASCQAMDPGGPNPCAVTDPANIDSNMVLVLRKLLDVEGFKDPSTCDDTDATTIFLTCCPP